MLLQIAALVALLGFLLERAAYRPLRNAGRLSAVVSALGASIFFQKRQTNTPPETVRVDRTNGAAKPLKWCKVTAAMVH